VDKLCLTTQNDAWLAAIYQKFKLKRIIPGLSKHSNCEQNLPHNKKMFYLTLSRNSGNIFDYTCGADTCVYGIWKFLCSIFLVFKCQTHAIFLFYGAAQCNVLNH
jgi:hypothetical protein